MADNKAEIDILINTAQSAGSVKELKKALKDLVDVQQEVDKNSPDFQKLVGAINDTEGAIGDLNDGFKTFAGSGMERLTSSTYLLKDGFDNLNLGKLQIGLEGIKQLPKAMAGEFNQLAGVVGKLNFKSLGSGMKELSKSGVGELTKSIVTLGKAILTNPILLLASVIAALVVVVVKFSDKIKPLVSLINILKEALDFVIDALIALTDALGITAIAAEESAERQIAAENKVRDNLEKNYNYRISLLQAQGKETADVEKEKQRLLAESAQKEMDLLIRSSVFNQSWTDEKMKKLDELRQVIENAKKEETIIDAKENKKQVDDEQKKLDEKKKLNEQYAKDRLTANESLNRQIEDQYIGLIQNDELREIEKAETDKTRADSSIENSKASALIKAQALLAQEETYQLQLLEINAKYREIEKQELLKKEEEDKKKKEEQLAKEAELKQIALDDLAADAELNVLKNESDLQSRLLQLETLRDIELEQTDITESEKNLIHAKYSAERASMEEVDRQQRIAKDQQEIQQKTATYQSYVTSIGQLADIVYMIQKNNLEAGSEAEKKAAEKNFKINKALRITSVIIDTASGIMNAFASLPTPAAIVAAAGVTIAGAANLLKINQTKFEGGKSSGSSAPPKPNVSMTPLPTSSSGSSSSTPSPTATAQFQAPQFYKLGEGGNMNNQQQTKVVLVETDVTKIQKNVNRIETRATQSLETN